MKIQLNRRRFLKYGLGAALLAGRPVLASLPERDLTLYNLHTGERLTRTYWAQGSYLPESLTEINHLLRDYRNGESIEMDTRLLDLLFLLRQKLEVTTAPFEIISGYRSPATNAMLAARSDGVAKSSLHTQGMAVDIRVPGRELVAVRNMALSLQAGGVGFYPASDFVHVDVGRVRRW